MIPAFFSAVESLRPAFSRQRSYALVGALLAALLLCGKYTTLTELFLQLGALLPGVVSRYWSLPKMLARRRWSSQMLMVLYLEFLRSHFSQGFIVADVTHTLTQGLHQQARHFRPNPHYRKHEQNQSKFLAGNSALTLAFVTRQQTASGPIEWVFGLGCQLLRPSRSNGSEQAMLRRAIGSVVPPGMLVVYDRGGNDAATINRAQRTGRHYLTRLNANAALYHDEACRQKIDPWCYTTKLQRDKRLVYRHEMLCYRKKVQGQLKVIVEIFYNRHRRRWQAIYYLSTDTSLSAEQIIGYYTSRRTIEQVHADSKLLNGFNSCRLHSATAIEGYLSLSILASGILEYLRYSLRIDSTQEHKISTHTILSTLGMHWYHPLRLTRGLVARYLKHQLTTSDLTLSTFRTLFSRHIANSP